MNLTKSQLIVISVALGIVLIFALIFAGVLPGLQKKSEPKKVKAELDFWGVEDSSSAYTNAFAQLKTIYPNVTVRYRNFSNLKEYEEVLLQALAAQRGPDIFVIPNSALQRYADKTLPLPQQKLSLIKLRSLFPKIVEQDFVIQNTIYALPLYIDTLALLYNQDLLNQAAVTSPPQTWEEFTELIPRLTQLNEQGQITQSGAAIGGTGKNIENAAHLLTLLMLQNGTEMVTRDAERATFGSPKGEAALEFYTQFARSETTLYTWNENMPYSLDAFSQGKTAMVFAYASQLPTVKARNTFLDVRVAATPQPKGAALALSYPNYAGLAVSRQSLKANLAWNIVLELATNPQLAESYITQTQKPPALNSLTNKYLSDPALAVFARQTLIARSFPQVDPLQIERIFSEMIGSVIENRATVKDALQRAEVQATQVLQRRY